MSFRNPTCIAIPRLARHTNHGDGGLGREARTHETPEIVNVALPFGVSMAVHYYMQLALCHLHSPGLATWSTIRSQHAIHVSMCSRAKYGTFWVTWQAWVGDPAVLNLRAWKASKQAERLVSEGGPGEQAWISFSMHQTNRPMAILDKTNTEHLSHLSPSCDRRTAGKP